MFRFHFTLFLAIFGFASWTWAYCPKQNPGDISPQIVILPPTGGRNFADRTLAATLCQAGLRVFILDYAQGSGLTTDLGIHDRLTREVIGELNQFLVQNPAPTVLVGSSLGAMYASTAFGLGRAGHPEFPEMRRIVGVVMTAGGGPLAKVLIQSEQSAVQQQRDLRMRGSGYRDLAGYESALIAAIQIDPLALARPECAGRVLMFNSTNDETVPSGAQEKLWRAWGSPQVQRFGTGHIATIVRVSFYWGGPIADFVKGLSVGPDACLKLTMSSQPAGCADQRDFYLAWKFLSVSRSINWRAFS